MYVLKESLSNSSYVTGILEGFPMPMTPKVASQKAFSHLFQKGKQMKVSPHHSRVPYYLWPVMWTAYCTVFWVSFVFQICDFPQERLKRLTSLKTITTWPIFYPLGSFQHSIFGAQYKKWIKKQYHTDVSAQRFNNLLNVTSYKLKGSRSIEDFINFMVRFLDGSQRAVSWPSDITQFSPMFYQGWSVSDECNREGVKL